MVTDSSVRLAYSYVDGVVVVVGEEVVVVVGVVVG